MRARLPQRRRGGPARRLRLIFEGLQALMSRARAGRSCGGARVRQPQPRQRAQARSGARRGAVRGAARACRCSSTPRAPIKLAVVGSGAAEKFQVAHMMRSAAGARRASRADAADALAVAVCHAHARRLRAAGAAGRALRGRAAMIGSLRGRLAAKTPPQLMVEVGGLGYELEAPMSTFYRLPAVGEPRCACSPTWWCARMRTCCTAFATEERAAAVSQPDQGVGRRSEDRAGASCRGSA